MYKVVVKLVNIKAAFIGWIESQLQRLWVWILQVPPSNFHNNGVDTVIVEFNLGFKIGQDDHSCNWHRDLDLWQGRQIRVLRPQAFQVSEKLGSYSSQPVRCWLYPSIINTIFKLKITKKAVISVLYFKLTMARRHSHNSWNQHDLHITENKYILWF